MYRCTITIYIIYIAWPWLIDWLIDYFDRFWYESGLVHHDHLISQFLFTLGKKWLKCKWWEICWGLYQMKILSYIWKNIFIAPGHLCSITALLESFVFFDCDDAAHGIEKLVIKKTFFVPDLCAPVYFVLCSCSPSWYRAVTAHFTSHIIWQLLAIWILHIVNLQ